MKTQNAAANKPDDEAANALVNDAQTQLAQTTGPKTAFFITPLGGDDSEIRRATDGLIDAVITPVLKKFGIDLVPPHKIKNPGNITKQVVRYILDSDLVIANLTGLNANVMYELAIRHARRKPVIVIALKGTVLPFDIAAERTIFYQNDMGGVVELMARLEETVPVALTDENPENPVYSGLESSIIHEELSKGKSTGKGKDDNLVQTYIVEKLEQLSDAVASLGKRPPSGFDPIYNVEVNLQSKADLSKFAEFGEKLPTLLPTASGISMLANQQVIKFTTLRKYPSDQIGQVMHHSGFPFNNITQTPA